MSCSFQGGRSGPKLGRALGPPGSPITPVDEANSPFDGAPLGVVEGHGPRFKEKQPAESDILRAAGK